MNTKLLLGFLLGGLAGCTNADPSPTPPVPVVVTVHITANCPGISPAYAVISNADRYSGGSFATRFFQVVAKQDQVDETRTVLTNPGPAYAADSLSVSIALPSPYANFTIPKGSFAQADVLVNGEVRKSVRVDEHTPLLNRNPYLEKQVFLRFKGL